MSRIALAFFTVAPIYGIIGMIWGGYMGVVEDHVMMPAHAHWNLMGLVVNSIMGAFYALAAGKISEKLAWIGFWLWNIGIIVLIALLVVVLAGNAAIAPATLIGEAAVILGMACFLANIAKLWKLPSA